MTWSPSIPPKDRHFIAQDEEGHVGQAYWSTGHQAFVWALSSVRIPLKYWQDFPKPMAPRDRYGAKLSQGKI